jgi:hypothetical protein
MPAEIATPLGFGLVRGTNRLVFRNPRGDQRYYAFYVNSNQAYYEWSVDGIDWTNAIQTITANPVNDLVDCMDVKIHDNGSSLTVFVIMIVEDDSAGNHNLMYRRGTISDTSDTISWTAAVQTIDSGILDLIAGGTFMSCAIARTDNGRMVVAYTEDFNTMGKDYRRTYLIGSDGDGGSPSWSGVTLWDDPSTNTNNQNKDDTHVGLESFSSSYPNRVLLVASVPSGEGTAAMDAVSAVPEWNGTAFSSTTQGILVANSGTNRQEGSVISGLVDEADISHAVYHTYSTDALVHKDSGTAGDDDWGSSTSVRSSTVDAATLTLDTDPATDVLYCFYHPTAAANDFQFRTTPVDTISWTTEETIPFDEDLDKLTSWNRITVDSLHIGIESTDTDIQYYEFVRQTTLSTTLADFIFPDKHYSVGPFGT